MQPPSASGLPRSAFTSVRGAIAEALGVGALAIVAFALFRIPHELIAPGAFRDDAAYLTLGRSIATGQGYHSLYIPGAPLHVKYPPGLPLLYSLLWIAFGTLDSVFAAAGNLSIVATAGAAATVWYVGRTRFGVSRWLTLPLAIVPFFLDSAIQYYTLPISESYYVLMWALAVALTLRLAGQENVHQRRDTILLGIVLALAMLIRTQSVALVAAVVVALVIARRWRAAGETVVLALVPITAWQLWLAAAKAHGAKLSTLPDETSYGGFIARGTPFHLIAGLASVGWTNVRYYLATFAAQTQPNELLGRVLCVALVVLAAYGAWQLRRDRAVLPLTVAASAMLTLLWPWSQDRLLIPVLPFAGLLAAVALQSMAWRLPHSGRRAVAGVVALAAVSVGYRQISLRTISYRAVVDGRTPTLLTPSWYLPQASRGLLMQSLWINKHALPGDQILVMNPEGVFLQTGRRAESSAPAESRLAVSVFAIPGRFLARAVADDSISIVTVERADGLKRDVDLALRACPNALRIEGQGLGGWPTFYRVVDPACIAREF